jgi:general secretion pathway protein B
MSYILEALKKAQAERARGAIPDLEARPLALPAADAGTRRKPLLLGGAALAAVVLAGAIAWFAMPRQGTAPPAAPAPKESALAAAPRREPAPSVPAAPVAPVAPAVPAAPAPSAPHPAAAAPRSAAPLPPVAKPRPADKPETVAQLQDLPPQIQREIPTLAVNGYIYASNPSERSVLINNHLRREGDQVAPGLTLEKLLPKEMVLNYRGYRYRIAY